MFDYNCNKLVTMTLKARLIISFVFLLNNVDVLFGANILVLNGLPSPSHHIWISSILDALVAREHNVTTIGPDVDNKVTPNLHEIHLENIYSTLYSGDDSFDFNVMSEANPFAEVFFYSDFCEIVCNATMESKGFEKMMSYPKNFKFDLILYDFTCGPCLLSILSRFTHQPPIVAITAFSHPPFLKCLIGEHPHYAYVPFYSLTYTDSMTFSQRFFNTMLYVFYDLHRQNIFVPNVEKMVENKLQEKLPTGLKELERTTNLALINSNPAFDFPEPLTPNVIEVAGLQIKDVKPLPKELEDFIEPARKGFVIFSLGTNIRSDQLPPKIQQDIIKAFEQLPDYHFLWKFESDTLPKHPAKNVLIQKWLPQNDLLGHPKVKVFITHGGMLSTQEASWYGVPVIGIPFIVDQHRNIQKCVTAGVGERIHIKSLTTEELKSKLLKVLGNKSYSEKMKLRSKHFRDQITKPIDRAVWWIEWAIRNPNAEHIKSPILKLGDFVGNLYDILLTICFGICVLVFILYNIVRRGAIEAYVMISRKQPNSKKQKKN